MEIITWYSLFVGLISQVLTSTVLVALQRFFGTGSADDMSQQSQEAHAMDGRAKIFDEYLDSYLNSTQLKTSVQAYSSFVAIDLIFEIVKTIVIYITTYMTTTVPDPDQLSTEIP